MYDDIGGKIKSFAKGSFYVEAIASVLAGLFFLVESEEIWPLFLIICGPIAAWVMSWFIYGYGEIIDRLGYISDNTEQSINTSSKSKVSSTFEPKCTVNTEGNHSAMPKEDSENKKPAEQNKTNTKEKYLVMNCPGCGEKLYFDEEVEKAECPYCGRNIQVK